MYDKVQNYLQEAAKARRTVTYSEVVANCQLPLNLRLDEDRTALGGLLDEISHEEHKKGRPLLSAVVVLARFGLPSAGFYRLAESLGLGTAKQLRQDFFGVDEIRRCFDEWAP